MWSNIWQGRCYVDAVLLMVKDGRGSLLGSNTTQFKCKFRGHSSLSCVCGFAWNMLRIINYSFIKIIF